MWSSRERRNGTQNLVIIQGPRSKFLSGGGGAKLDETFFGGGMLRNFYLISLK